MLTEDLLKRLSKAAGGTANASVVAGIVANEQYLIDGGISTPGRLSEFLAQACLETDYFKTLKEYGGATYFKRYDGRKDLGNTVAGDGPKFSGRGIFQLTGRYNYTTYGKRLGVDLLKEPELAARPDISVRAAVLYWNDKGLNAYADAMDTKAISRAINRGSPKSSKPANHEADRIKLAKLARSLIKSAPVVLAEPAKGNDQWVEAVTKPPPVNKPDAELFAAPPSESLWRRFLSAFGKRLSA